MSRSGPWIQGRRKDLSQDPFGPASDIRSRGLFLAEKRKIELFTGRAKSIILGVHFEEGHGMGADRTFFRGFFSFVNVAAVPAVPFDRRILPEDPAGLDIPQEGQVPRFMFAFHLGNLGEGVGDFRESLLRSRFGKSLVKGGPFEVFSGCRGFQIDGRVSDHSRRIRRHNFGLSPFEKFKEKFGVFLLVVGRVQKNCRNLLEPRFFCLAGKKSITVPGLRFPGKSRQKIFFRLASPEFHVSSSLISAENFHESMFWVSFPFAGKGLPILNEWRSFCSRYNLALQKRIPILKYRR